jgi:hypothetical protein
MDHVMPFFPQRLDDEFADERIVRRRVFAPSAPRRLEIWYESLNG